MADSARRLRDKRGRGGVSLDLRRHHPALDCLQQTCRSCGCLSSAPPMDAAASVRAGAS